MGGRVDLRLVGLVELVGLGRDHCLSRQGKGGGAAMKILWSLSLSSVCLMKHPVCVSPAGCCPGPAGCSC